MVVDWWHEYVEGKPAERALARDEKVSVRFVTPRRPATDLRLPRCSVDSSASRPRRMASKFRAAGLRVQSSVRVATAMQSSSTTAPNGTTGGDDAVRSAAAGGKAKMSWKKVGLAARMTAAVPRLRDNP